MRILLDESVPRRLGPLLEGHETVTVQHRGWAGIQNGKLLILAAAEFDVLLTFDRNIEHQQNLTQLPVAVVVVVARSNRLQAAKPLVPDILKTLGQVAPRTLSRVGT